MINDYKNKGPLFGKRREVTYNCDAASHFLLFSYYLQIEVCSQNLNISGFGLESFAGKPGV